MSSEKYVLNKISSVTEFIPILWTLWNQYKYVIVTLRFGRDRSLDQNSLWFAMYKRIAETLEYEIQYSRAYCKLRFGVPILMCENEDFRKKWAIYVLENPRLQTWKDQLDMMTDSSLGSDGYPVTRWMDRKQGCAYTDAIDRHFTEQGVFFGDLLDENK